MKPETDFAPAQQTAKFIVDFAPSLPRPAVLCTVVSVVGSAPQEVGARMWVTDGRFEGTVGGGKFEAEALEHARKMLAGPKALSHLKEWTLCKELGQCCGGRVQVFFENVPRRRRAHLFGGGHVGRALAQVLSGSGVDVLVIDERPVWGSPGGLPAGATVLRESPLGYARSRSWDAFDAACIFTHSHDLDFELLRHLIDQPLGYLGLIGSEHKAAVFQARLRALNPGLSAGDLEDLWDGKVSCPMGEPLRSKNPTVIATSIAMELYKEWVIS